AQVETAVDQQARGARAAARLHQQGVAGAAAAQAAEAQHPVQPQAAANCTAMAGFIMACALPRRAQRSPRGSTRGTGSAGPPGASLEGDSSTRSERETGWSISSR